MSAHKVAVAAAERATEMQNQNVASVRLMAGRLFDQYMAYFSRASEDLVWPSVSPEHGFERIHEVVRHHVRATAGDGLCRKMWERSKIVYSIDPDLWNELADADPDDTVPTWLFSYLPHPNPFIAFPEPFKLNLKNGTGQYQVVEGVFVTGVARPSNTAEEHRKVGRVIVSTHHAESQGVMLVYAGRVFNPDDTPVKTSNGDADTIFTRITVSPEDGSSLREMVGAILSRFQPEPVGKEFGGKFQDDIPKLAAASIAALVYVCAKNADLYTLPPVARKKQRDVRAKKQPVTVVEVGYRVGAELRAWAASDGKGGTGTGTKRPHIRRAHFHTYRTGPGRRESIVKWLAPIPIAFDKNKDADMPTVVST